MPSFDDDFHDSFDRGIAFTFALWHYGHGL